MKMAMCKRNGLFQRYCQLPHFVLKMNKHMQVAANTNAWVQIWFQIASGLWYTANWSQGTVTLFSYYFYLMFFFSEGLILYESKVDGQYYSLYICFLMYFKVNFLDSLITHKISLRCCFLAVYASCIL